ncbi:hypothetical protein Dxin01_00940 [Deinococcus xinjiangensis]|uniref:Uncharacterized protein n=1 Tax=Deinococcus xinjiangensis TaxID=457454 RepID=A0ABP9V7F0_9DEIO
MYQASTSLLSTLPDNSNRVVSGSSVTASVLPDGAVPEVLHSKSVVRHMQKAVDESNSSPKLKQKIDKSLTDELLSDRYN